MAVGPCKISVMQKWEITGQHSPWRLIFGVVVAQAELLAGGVMERLVALEGRHTHKYHCHWRGPLTTLPLAVEA
jgi:hypothetical protein